MTADPILWGASTSPKHKVQIPDRLVPSELRPLPGPAFVLTRGTPPQMKRKALLWAAGAAAAAVVALLAGLATGTDAFTGAGLLLGVLLVLVVVPFAATLAVIGPEWGWTVASHDWIARLDPDGVRTLRFDDVVRMRVTGLRPHQTVCRLYGPDGTVFKTMLWQLPEPVEQAVYRTYHRLGGTETGSLLDRVSAVEEVPPSPRVPMWP